MTDRSIAVGTRRVRGALIASTLVLAILAGCSTPTGPAPPNEHTEGQALPLVHHHLPGARPVAAGALAGIEGGYSPTGAPAFEPTIGATSSGALFVASFRPNGTHILRSLDGGAVWTDVGPFLGPTGFPQVPSSNDPFLYVDPWTDRIHKFDMHATLGMTLETSDDEGATWTLARPAFGAPPVRQDHQSLASAPPRTSSPQGYANVLAYCVNRGVPQVGAWCSTSHDGGLAWTPLLPGYPAGEPQCEGLHGHLVGGADGRFYRGNPACDGPAVYRSDDEGITWTQHVLPGQVGLLLNGDPRQSHEIAVAVDEENQVYALWIGGDGLPYMASSRDLGESWLGPWMVGAPMVTAAGFPAIAAGAAGRVAFAYVATQAPDGFDGPQTGTAWFGFLGFTMDALGDEPVLATVQVDPPSDPLYHNACGNVRCGGLGDFIGMVIDPSGRPWVAMAHEANHDEGIVATLVKGPALRGDPLALPALEWASAMPASRPS